MKRKTELRREVANCLLRAMTNPEIYDTYKYERMKEVELKGHLHKALLDEISGTYKALSNCSVETARKKARTCLRWEGDKKTTVNNFMFFGTQHRPDFDLELYGTKYAIEVKKGDSGSSIRSGIGQSLVYNTFYDFCVYLFVDTSPEKKIKNSFTGIKESEFVKNLWTLHNVLFEVV